MTTLLLWDIDGTLVYRASTAHAEALRQALQEVHGVGPDQTDRQAISAAGRTDGEIARLLLLQAGVDAAQIDAKARDVEIATSTAYARLCPPDLTDKVLPGIPELLEELSERPDVLLSLVTGNYEPVARLKLERAGLGKYFPRHQGGFGSDSEDRAGLPAIARRRAGHDGVSFPRENTIVIGDTPRDIACARADGVRCLAVATGPHSAEDLQHADAVADSPEGLRDLVLGALTAP